MYSRCDFFEIPVEFVNANVETTSERGALQVFDEYIDDATESEVVVMGMRFRPSTVLRELDPAAYREAFCNWLDGTDEFLELTHQYKDAGEFVSYAEMVTLIDEWNKQSTEDEEE
jgi:hypothetical protein